MPILLAGRANVYFGRMRSVPLAYLLISLLAVLVAVQAARLFWTFLMPVGPLGDWRSRSVDVIPAEARISLFSGFDPFFRNDLAITGSDTVTALNLTLFGIRANASTGGGSAIIAGEDGVQYSFGVGEEVMPGVILDSVMFDHVILSRGGVKESLFIDQSVPAETVGTPSPPAAAAPAPTGGGAALNAETLQKSIGFAPRSEGGRVTGLVLQPRDDGTMLQNAGFQAGDIVVAVNGRAVSAASDIASQLRPGARLSIDVERGGSKVPISLILEKP